METLQLHVPDLYADHHVLKVRAALGKLSGVQNVIASSAFRVVAVEYDPALTNPDHIKAALAEAGYVVPDPASASNLATRTEAVPVGNRHADPAWDRLGTRIIRTDQRDAKASR